jgi:hypothetical protein
MQDKRNTTNKNMKSHWSIVGVVKRATHPAIPEVNAWALTVATSARTLRIDLGNIILKSSENCYCRKALQR